MNGDKLDAVVQRTRHRSAARAVGRVALVGVDVALLLLAVWVAYALRFHVELFALERVDTPPFRMYLQVYGLLVGLVLVLGRPYRIYQREAATDGIEETYGIAKVTTLATVTVLALTFFYRGFSYSRLVFAYFGVIAPVLLTGSHAAFRAWIRSRFRRGLDRRRTLFVGGIEGHLVDRIVQDPLFGAEVLGYCADAPVAADDEADLADGAADAEADGEGDTGASDAAGAPAEGDQSGPVGALISSAVGEGAAVVQLARLGTLADLDTVIRTRGVEDVIVVEHTLSHRRLLRAIDACEGAGAVCRLVPPIYDLLVEASDFSYVDNVPFIRIDERRFRLVPFAWKRVFDVIVSATALVVFGPLLLWIARKIRKGSEGPALFIQQRAGENGRPFPIYKFRTMCADAPEKLKELVSVDALKEPVFKLDDDPRITDVGRMLRRTSLDELPQLLNVLKGDMSLVGPRPEEVALVERYDVWQRRRLKVKPGITGLQQVTNRGCTELNERVRLDIRYIRKQSFLLDLVILFRTVKVVITGQGAR